MVFGFSKRHFLGLAHSVLAAAAQGVQRLGQRLVVSWGWGHPAAALPHPQLGGTGPWTQLCPAILDLPIKAWSFCSWACEVLAGLSPPQGVWC